MNRVLHHLLALLLTASALHGVSLDDLQNSFIAHYDALNTKRDEQLDKLETSYRKALERNLDQTKASGKLELVIPVRAEIEALKTGAKTLPDLPRNAPYEFKQMRGKFSEASGKITGIHAKALSELAKKMKAALALKETELTKAGEIDNALAAKRMSETLANDSGVKAAQALMNRTASFGNAPPALQLRRSGDNLEVIVHYDSRGKISMDSPVENVREKTGEGKELGSTKAKSLGAFVGAKGYEVDPWLAYDQEFDGKEMGAFKLSKIEPKFRFEHAGQIGVRLSYQKDGINPYGSIKNVLPPLKSSGTYRVSCRYYVPKENRAISGIFFLQGSGGLPIGERCEEQGVWVDAELESKSLNELETLMFYLVRKKGKNLADAAGDSVVLASFRIEHIKFSAYVQAEFGPKGERLADSADSFKQRPYVLNGVFSQR